MGFIDSFKRATAGLARMFSAKPATTEQVDEAVTNIVAQRRRSTTASRRFQRDANRRYLHVSKDIPQDYPWLVAVLGERDAMHYLRTKVPGETYDIGINAVKRNIAALPKAERKEARRVFDRMLKDSGVK